ncbi:MAG: threonylcarbamoyl-AMP synthase [Muribaculaceae bacterium]|nr:threonylcarbamoyl-AMP synthase [Muribaculaceae bacterium]
MEQEIRQALEVLRKGGIILYPTDTIWGIGCDATCAEAVSRIYALKERADSKSMLALVSDIAMLERWVKSIPETAEMLIDVAVDPLTIIYDNPVGIADNLRAEDGSLGIRITSDDFCRQLCRRLRHPLVSTSANISGQKSPASYADITPEIIAGVDYVVNLRQDERPNDRKPSAIIKVSDNGVVKVIR